MKVGAHPLVVAVALGLVGPQVLEEAEPPRDDKSCAGCRDVADREVDAPTELGSLLTDSVVTTTIEPPVDWTSAPAPAPEDFARVADAFARARRLV